ncbi:MAG: PEP-CTERM sorting domain-containing protein [Crocosphaera sp.]
MRTAIEAFDINNVSLGQFTLPGTSSEALDNSAQFYGVINDVPNISKITFSSDIPNKAIGINFLSLVTVSVPEPSPSVGLILLVGYGVILINKRKNL